MTVYWSLSYSTDSPNTGHFQSTILQIAGYFCQSDLIGSSWTGLIEIVSLEPSAGRRLEIDMAPSAINGRRVTMLQQIEALTSQGRIIGQTC